MKEVISVLKIIVENKSAIYKKKFVDVTHYAFVDVYFFTRTVQIYTGLQYRCVLIVYNSFIHTDRNIAVKTVIKWQTNPTKSISIALSIKLFQKNKVIECFCFLSLVDVGFSVRSIKKTSGVFCNIHGFYDLHVIFCSQTWDERLWANLCIKEFIQKYVLLLV